MTVTFVHCTPDAEHLIVDMARVSNPDNQGNYETGPKLLRYLIKHKHWSPFEMASLCVKIDTERDISAQILRHRSFSFQEYCLSGNTLIPVSGESGIVQYLPISELYSKWNKPRFKARYARSYDTNVKRFITAPILSVYQSGEKNVYRYAVKSAYSEKTIDCTREHRVLTKEKGFVTFEEAYTQQLSVALNGEKTFALPYHDPKMLKDNAWMGSTAFAEKFGIKDVTARKWFKKHGIVPAKPNNVAASKIDITFEAKKASFMKWARAYFLEKSCSKCGHNGSSSRLELSHIIAHNGDESLCFNEDNLQTLCATCHRKYDIEVQGKQYGWTLNMTAKWGKIIKEEYLGVQMTYDIEMDHPTHNFVADGIVVHNSTRYAEANYPENFKLRAQDIKNRQNSFDNLDAKTEEDHSQSNQYILDIVYTRYEAMLGAGIAKETARRILPLCSPTTLYMHGTIRSWIHYLEIRCSIETQLEHRLIANQCKEIFTEKFPVIAQAIFTSEQ